ncbi:MAG: DNA primase [Bacteroidetes bacterium]|nr:MAG: DNA primase [Bacteroidota bacterium]
MGRIPQNIVDQIYNAMDIVDIIGDYVQLKKKGANFWALSPFANEKTPSFAVNPVKGIFKDFSSGKGGTAIAFLMEMEGYTYVEALRHIARKYGIEVEEEDESDEQREARDKRESLFIVNEFAASYFHDNLLQSEEGRRIGLSYFKERGLLEATIKTFRLGYASDAWDAFAGEALRRQYQEPYLLELGLVSRSEKNDKLYDRFRGRVMFPITNPTGKVVGFGGRILGNRKDVGKYINSSESEIYHKSQVLYGLEQAKKAIRDEDLCILTEGYLDVILLHQNGIQHVVASSGTALTPEQIRLIRRYTRNVLMIYDGDAAGIKAALRGIDLLLEAEMQAKVLILPDQHDPDSYVRAVGAQGFRDYAEREAMDFVQFKLKVLPEGQDRQDPKVQTELIKGLAETVALIPDRVQRQMYIRHVAQQVDITEGLMTHAVDEARRTQQRQAYRDRRRQETQQARQQPEVPAEEGVVEAKPAQGLAAFDRLSLTHQEREILRVLINYHDREIDDAEYGAPVEDQEGNRIAYEQIPLVEFFLDELENLPFENPLYERVKQELFAAYEAGGIQINHFLHHEEAPIRRLVSDLLLPDYEISPNWRKHGAYVLDLDANLKRTVEAPVLHYKSRKINALIDQCQEEIKAAQAAGNAAELDKLLESSMYLIKMRREIHKKLGTEGAIRGEDAHL